MKSVDLVLAEDTRHTRKLLNHYGIAVDTLSFHAHNEKGRTQRIVERLQRGEVRLDFCTSHSTSKEA